MNYDIYGLIVQKDMDGGDTAGRESDFWYAYALSDPYPAQDSEEFVRVINQLEVAPGLFVRHPRPPYNDPNDFSRDQSVPLILALSEMGERGTLKHMLVRQLKNLFRYQNGDIGLFQDAGYYIRGFKCLPMYPLLLLGDTQLLINSVLRVVISWVTRDNTSDDINHTLALLQAQRRMPTLISFVARKLYKRCVKGGVQFRWDRYFRPETGANEFNEIYRSLIASL